MNDTDFLIGGASASLIIMLFIQMIKSYGLPSRIAPLAAIILGVSFSVLSEWATPTVTTEPVTEVARWVTASVRGFMVGLGAVGIYAVTKNAQDTIDKHRAEDVQESGDAVLATVVSPDPQAEEGGAVVEIAPPAIGGTNGTDRGTDGNLSRP